MNRNNSVSNALVCCGIALCTLIGTQAQAQTLTDLMSLVQRSRSVIQNNALIDDTNPESVTFASNIDNQLVELNLHGARLNDSFATAINYQQAARGSVANPKKVAVVPATSINFGDLHVILDGCDVTTALLTQCNTNQCWDASPSTPRSNWSGVFGTAINLSLSVLNPQQITGCTPALGQVSFFDAAHPQHTLQLVEAMTGQGKGGSLNYQVILYNKAYQ